MERIFRYERVRIEVDPTWNPGINKVQKRVDVVGKLLRQNPLRSSDLDRIRGIIQEQLTVLSTNLTRITQLRDAIKRICISDDVETTFSPYIVRVTALQQKLQQHMQTVSERVTQMNNSSEERK
ncbi:MAG: hypothetical protein K1X28_06385 [Parachlamydiales bacterium]|nr:hypothetical protein [Parachlamydiales bacterium]